MNTIYSSLARYYDKQYAWKDYAGEAERIVALAAERGLGRGASLLDVACGTGLHLCYLQDHFKVAGLDISEELLAVARERLPLEVPLFQGDMQSFELGLTFDVITCLFSSIGYMRTITDLHQAVGAMARHLAPGGLLIVEPWFTRDTWHPNTVHALFVDEPELKLARVNTSLVQGSLSIFDLHFLVGTPQGTTHFVEHHEMGLFDEGEMLDAFANAGLEVSYDPDGLTGRGLYLGLAPRDGETGS